MAIFRPFVVIFWHLLKNLSQIWGSDSHLRCFSTGRNLNWFKSNYKRSKHFHFYAILWKKLIFVVFYITSNILNHSTFRPVKSRYRNKIVEPKILPKIEPTKHERIYFSILKFCVKYCQKTTRNGRKKPDIYQ